MGEGSLQLTAGKTLSVTPTGAHGAFLVASVPPEYAPAGAASEAYAQVADTLRASRLQIVQERVFGTLEAQSAVQAARREALQTGGLPADTAINYIPARPTSGEGFAGAIIRAVPAVQRPEGARTILDGGIPCGRTWQTGGVTSLILENIRGTGSPAEDNSRTAQARRAIQRADRLLRENGARYDRIVRTWFYLANILDWYGPFNQARNALYAEFGLRPAPGEQREPPASTGIQADLPEGTAVSLELLAVIAPPGRARALRNPEQPDAFVYGSAFSRGAVVTAGGESLIEVSGTASIDECGVSIHPGNIRAQVRTTMEKVAAVLKQADASLQDICAATAFVKRSEDAAAAREEMAALGLASLPAVWVLADVCREELLFELDAEAVTPSP